MLFQVAEPNPDSPKGMCYVETKSLDGETNLKVRRVMAPLVGKVCFPTAQLTCPAVRSDWSGLD